MSAQEPWNFTETQRRQFREAQAEGKVRARTSAEQPHVVDDYPDASLWKWRVEGLEVPSGTLIRRYDESGVVKAELAGAALDWLVNSGPIWDSLDTDAEFTITITPVAAPDAEDGK